MFVFSVLLHLADNTAWAGLTWGSKVGSKDYSDCCYPFPILCLLPSMFCLPPSQQSPCTYTSPFLERGPKETLYPLIKFFPEAQIPEKERSLCSPAGFTLTCTSTIVWTGVRGSRPGRQIGISTCHSLNICALILVVFSVPLPYYFLILLTKAAHSSRKRRLNY